MGSSATFIVPLLIITCFVHAAESVKCKLGSSMSDITGEKECDKCFIVVANNRKSYSCWDQAPQGVKCDMSMGQAGETCCCSSDGCNKDLATCKSKKSGSIKESAPPGKKSGSIKERAPPGKKSGSVEKSGSVKQYGSFVAMVILVGIATLTGQ